ncbi:hypothetical protein KUV26_09465 [Leisingera daeponensis]|uniref:Uncharacterized protein n=1 Tax=Leisingera daeponensis TaxID=405746 RepID=A0ABS7NEM9_9RHOB|nr:hypothetical protein [Leisingera daeponensis]MBY6056037.1 hypothetical protein [Leisingera daeponensis]MBY6139658.1 hypothetical protein [Leisingera daeponensis]
MEQALPRPFPAPLAEAGTRPEPKPARAPLFIQDAVTPWPDGTLLLALWRLQEAGKHED